MKTNRTTDLSILLAVTCLLLTSLALGIGCNRDHSSSIHSKSDTNAAIVAAKHHSEDSGWNYGARHIFWQIAQNPDSIMPLNLPEDSTDGSTGIGGLYEKYEDHVQAAMDSVYKVILDRYKLYPDIHRSIKRAQAAWLQYREAELKAIIDPTLHGSWPATEECYIQYWLALMRERIGELLMWTKLPPEVAKGQNICSTYGLNLRNSDTVVFTK